MESSIRQHVPDTLAPHDVVEQPVDLERGRQAEHLLVDMGEGDLFSRAQRALERRVAEDAAVAGDLKDPG